MRKVNGNLKMGFINPITTNIYDLILQFEDLSLHHIKEGKSVEWIREEGLS